MWFASLVVFVVVIVVSEPPGPEARPETAIELHRLMVAGEARDQIVDYRFTRTLPDGRSTSAQVVTAHFGSAQLTRSGSSLTVALPDRRFLCDTGPDGPACTEEQVANAALGNADVVLTAVAAGAYDVFPAPPERIVGERTRCFRVVVHVRDQAQRLLNGLGRESTFCLTPDGMLLRAERVMPSGTDSRVATRVVRDPGRDEIRAIAGEYEAGSGIAPG